MTDANAPIDEAILNAIARTLRTDDGFNIHYTEIHSDDTTNNGSTVWQCRWDCQSSTHSTREHFHPPPDADEPIDSQFPDDYRNVLSMVLAAVRARIEECWQDDEETN